MKQPQASPFPADSTEASVAMAFDPLRGEALLYGVYVGLSTIETETWTLQGTTANWKARTPVPRPASWPAAHGEGAMVWDPVRRAVVMFGGLADQGNGFSDELWEWDGTSGTWNNLTPEQRPAAWPQGRAAHAMAYDTGRNRLAIYGGWGPLKYPGYAPDLWEWNSEDRTWIDRTPNTLPANWPDARQSAAMAYDPSTKRIVMYGGWDNTPRGDTWEWDGAAGAWTNRTPTTDTPSRPPFGEWLMMFDPCRGKPTLLGGIGLVQDNSGLGRTPPQAWEWTSAGGSWSSLMPSPLPASWPPVRDALAAAWDGQSMRTLVVMGPGRDVTTTDIFPAETWTWGAALTTR
jgi:hypothetical protein